MPRLGPRGLARGKLWPNYPPLLSTMKLLLLLFVALVVGALSYRSMNTQRGEPTQGAPAIDLRSPTGGVPLEAFGPKAAEDATKARMEGAK